MMTKETEQIETHTAGSELTEDRWSVVSFDRREASGLNYAQAEAMLDELLAKNVYGLCIVTDEAAKRGRR